MFKILKFDSWHGTTITMKQVFKYESNADYYCVQANQKSAIIQDGRYSYSYEEIK